jgi:aminopeptidase-like protein
MSEPVSNNRNSGDEMHLFASELFPICRSITGNGVRQTLVRIQEHLPSLTLHEVPSGTKAFDWVVPDEWNINAASLIGPEGNIVVDFADNNLHVVGYSTPIEIVLPLDELQDHLYSLPEMPEVIPYVTSFYEKRWGFCLPHRIRDTLEPGDWKITIESSLTSGHLTYGELLLPGNTTEEIFLSTYICHPSMANNEISGPVVTTWLAKWLQSQENHYSYRIIFVPETIGSIVYISRHLDEMRSNIIAGFVITCVGDERCYSYLPSRTGSTISDRVAQYVLANTDPNYLRYEYLNRGSDERQYCSPGVDLPVCSVMRSKYGEYPEYHTSADDLTLITSTGLEGSYNTLKQCIALIEMNRIWKATTPCEPQLGKLGLYPTISTRVTEQRLKVMMDFLAYADGSRDLLAIAELIRAKPELCSEIAEILQTNGLISEVDHL